MATTANTASRRGRTGGASPAGSADARSGLILVAGMTGVMWAEEAVDTVSNQWFNQFGIRPWHLSGLDGILFSPFLHAGFGHLISNTIPFLILGSMIAIFAGFRKLIWATVISMLVGGVGVWLTSSPNSVVIGASGLVFGYAGYLIARGIFDRRLGQLALAVVVIALFGGSLLFSLLPREGVSWQGHLFGAVGGILAAYWLREKRPGHRSGNSPGQSWD